MISLQKDNTSPGFFSISFSKDSEILINQRGVEHGKLERGKIWFHSDSGIGSLVELVEITSRKRTNDNRNPTIWRCISYETWWFFIAMWVFEGIAILFKSFHWIVFQPTDPVLKQPQSRWHPSWLRGASPSCLRGWVDFHVQSWTIWGSQQLLLLSTGYRIWSLRIRPWKGTKS